LAEDVEAELQQAYANALNTLSTHRGLVDRVAQALMDKSEISGPDFLRMAANYQAEAANGSMIAVSSTTFEGPHEH
jgi:ATP-dependent Zn protease